ncbi:HPP family protein [Kitasatospora paranensis]|uniref:HPP family protein n=1 Tax=Kitasatospora paranensis TaxID=258053 RepID=A0ABW2FQY5_9ACTN
MNPELTMSTPSAPPERPGATARALRRPVTSRAPARPSPSAAAHTLGSTAAVLLMLVAVGTVIHQPLLIPPLAASAALVHSVPHLPLAQPRSVVGGHLLCGLVGLGVHATLGSSPWTAALAGVLALATTMLARTPHSPACATAVIATLQGPPPVRFVASVAGAAVLLVAGGWLTAKARRAAPAYPAYWW